jgi:DNA-binding NarL/FixJ family response regulator
MVKKDATAPKADSAAPPIKVLIVDDHPVVREGLAMQIATQPDMQVCGEAESATGALALLESTQPDVAIIDISLKDDNGIDLIRRIKGRNDAVRILVLSMYPESLFGERALRAGAQGYIYKGEATGHLVDAIRAVLTGEVFVSAELAEKMSRIAAGAVPVESSPIERLSVRELQAFELMGQGLNTESIASRMHVSPKTVETYRARIKEKLGLSNVTELVQRATQWLLESK